MNKSLIRLAVYILIIIGLNLALLAYILNETLSTGLMNVGYMITASFLISFAFISVLVYHVLSKSLLRPLNDITELVKDLNQGHYWRRIHFDDQDGPLFELMNQSNQLASHLQTATEHQILHADRLQAVIRHMASGLLFIDHKGRIVITNDMLLHMLNWDSDFHQYIYHEVPLTEEVMGCIKDAFTTEQEIKQHITLEAGVMLREIDLLVVPVKDIDQKITGVVLVFHDITDLKQLEQTRKDFVANVSHELKTPITSIKGFSETLLDGAMYSEHHLKEFLGIIRKESDRLYRLIQDLLDLSHIEQKKLHLTWEDVDLGELVQDSLILVEPEAQQKNISCVFDYRYAVVQGNADRLRQIMLNLLSNSIQYTPENGRVEVAITDWQNDGYSICIRDNGIGIKKNDLTRIFERFYRVDRARSRASGGTGLGLAIVKHLIDAHDGELSVDSEWGQGSTFCVHLHKEHIAK